MSLVADRTFEAPAQAAFPAQPRAVFLHATRSGQPNRRSLAGHAREMTSAINWFLGDSGLSSNLIISPTEIVRMVPDEDYGIHAGQHNPFSWSIELTQALATDPFLDGHYELAAKAGREYVRMGVPPVYLPHFSNGMEGFTGHEDSEQGVAAGKSDPGPWEWDRFIAMVQEPEGEDDMTFIGVGHDERYAPGHRNFESFRLYVTAEGLKRDKIPDGEERAALNAAGYPLMKMTKAELELYAL